jgi:CRP/FNR family transcriptional regulator, cyclic AMP receptor protein
MANPFRLVAPLGRRPIWHKGSTLHLHRAALSADRPMYAHREEQLFSDLSPAAAERLAAISSTLSYPQGANLFVEGQEPGGVFVLLQGRVKLSFASAQRQSLTLRIAGQGEALGLPATLLGKPYEVTAQSLDPVEANLIGRQDFLNFLRDHQDAAVCVARYSTWIYDLVLAQMRSVGLKLSPEERIWWLLLHRSAGRSRGAMQLRLNITPGEIGLATGASRAMVDRLLRQLIKRRLVQLKGSTLVIRDRAAIERLAARA